MIGCVAPPVIVAPAFREAFLPPECAPLRAKWCVRNMGSARDPDDSVLSTPRRKCTRCWPKWAAMASGRGVNGFAGVCDVQLPSNVIGAEASRTVDGLFRSAPTTHPLTPGLGSRSALVADLFDGASPHRQGHDPWRCSHKPERAARKMASAAQGPERLPEFCPLPGEQGMIRSA